MLLCLLQNIVPALSGVASYSSESTNLKDVLADKIVAHQKKVTAFRKEHAGTIVQAISIDMVHAMCCVESLQMPTQIYGGMRSMKALVCETSVLDPEEGIRFRGYSIPECQDKLPKAPGGAEPLPEGIWWLLCTGDIPSQAQVRNEAMFYQHNDTIHRLTPSRRSGRRELIFLIMWRRYSTIYRRTCTRCRSLSPQLPP